jgi:mono/diheme cytochrome c family protein
MTMRAKRTSAWIIGAAGTVAMLAGAAQAAQDMAVVQGKQLYEQYCASCHGADGKGDGPVASTLTPKPSDLTQIATHNGGRFPFYDVMLMISGRGPEGQNEDTSLPGLPKAHGSAAMPVWGQIFSRDELSKGSSLDLQLQATGKIMLITEYIQSIQQK